MTTVSDALAAVDRSVRPLAAEEVPLTASAGRVLSAPPVAAHRLPRFDQSAVDGYAVRHADIASVPATLPVVTTVAAAPQSTHPLLAPATAARIFTGGLVPVGADTVVRQESTDVDATSGAVTVVEPVAPGADLRVAGEEVDAGATLAAPGTTVTPGLLASLASAGIAAVEVTRSPRVRVLVTGDELVPVGQPLGLGQVPDSNGPMIAATLAGWGIGDVTVTPVADRVDAVRAALAEALDDADIVISSGGVSVGDFDHVPEVAEDLGAERLLWKVAQRPGGPLYVARRHGVHLFGLPGNPAAVLVNLHVYVRRALDLLAGRDPHLRWQRGVLADEPARQRDKTFWLRARAVTDDRGMVLLHPLGNQGSHMMSNLAQATALVRLPGLTEEGPIDVVTWLPIDG